VVLSAGGSVFCWGGQGQMGHRMHGAQLLPERVDALECRQVTRVAAGIHHTAVLTEDGVVLTFGYNRHGQLGRATDQEQSSLPGEVERAALAGERAVDLAASGNRTGVVTSSGRLVTFGDGIPQGGLTT
jgi:YD repeat-containing protein